MNEMVDRVAEAISLSFHEEGYIEGQSDPDLWNEFVKAAREAILAMREPSKNMLICGHNGGWHSGICGDHPCEEKATYYLYKAMIDTALLK